MRKEKKYTAHQIKLAARIGEVNHYDAEHIISLLDEAVEAEKAWPKEKQVDLCRCIKFTDGDKWYLNGCKIHANEI